MKRIKFRPLHDIPIKEPIKKKKDEIGFFEILFALIGSLFTIVFTFMCVIMVVKLALS